MAKHVCGSSKQTYATGHTGLTSAGLSNKAPFLLGSAFVPPVLFLCSSYPAIASLPIFVLTSYPSPIFA